MRRLLDAFYALCGAAAAAFLAAICLAVLVQVGANVANAATEAVFGEAIGLIVPSYADFTGFFLAASSFLALAYTMRHGSHIRVSLVIQNFGPSMRRWIDMGGAAVGAGLAGYAAWYATLLCLESFEYNDMSPGLVAVPLWIPQSAMAFGLAALAVALLDDLAALAAGRPAAFGGDGGAAEDTVMSE